MKFLHTADLHLDSAYVGAGVLGADERRATQRRMLSRIFALARSERCDLILMAGDLFDGKYVTPETAELFLRLCGESDCPIVIAPGNHDPYIDGSFYKNAKLPEQVYLFNSTELQCFAFDAIRTKVYGYAFCSGVMSESPLLCAERDADDGYVRLLCAHADTSSPISRYAPLTAGDVAALGIDYAALGHIHNPPAPISVGSGEMRYCGFAEGRSFDECGEGSVLLVTVEDGSRSVERRTVSEVRYEQVELDVSACADTQAICAAIEGAVSAFTEGIATHLRLSLLGTADPDALAPILANAEPFSEKLASLKIQNLTIPSIDGAALQQDVTLRGALYRSLYVRLIDPDPAVRRCATRALQIGLAAIDGRRIPTEEDDV